MPNLLLSKSVRNLIMSILACMEHFEIVTGVQIKDWVYTCLSLAFLWGFFVMLLCQHFLFSLNSCSLNGIWQWRVYLIIWAICYASNGSNFFFLSPSDYFFTQLILDFRVPVKFTLLRSDATHLPLFSFFLWRDTKIIFFHVFKYTSFGYMGLI